MKRHLTQAALVLACAAAPAHADDAVPTLDSIRRALGDSVLVEGDVVYVDFWASWCGPCRQSFPWMGAMAARYHDAGLRVVTVNVDRNPELGRRFADEMNVALPVIEDPQGELAREFALEAMPTAFIFDRSGTLRARHEGFRKEDGEELELLLEELLAQDAGKVGAAERAEAPAERTP